MAARPRRAAGESHRGSDGRAVEESAATGQASGVSGLFKVLHGPLELGVSRPHISRRQAQTTCLLTSWLHVVELLWCPHLSGQSRCSLASGILRYKFLKISGEAIVKKKIRVIQYGIGPIGASIVRLMRQKNSLEIVGAIDTDPAKTGRDLGEVVGAPDAPWGVPILPDAQSALETPADIVVHSTSSYLTSVVDQLFECIAAGCCVVSTCEELAYPFHKHPELSKKLDTAAIEEGVALVGTGVNPGFVMDKLALTLSAVAQRIDWVSAVRIVDASKRRLPLQKKIGAGMTPDEFRTQ